MTDAFSKNFIDYEEYPQTAELQNRCVNMIARLYHAPETKEGENAMGTSTVGSSEAIMLSVLAMKKRWANKRKAEGKDYTRPNIIMVRPIKAPCPTHRPAAVGHNFFCSTCSAGRVCDMC
jgi:glutamate decarboxylase